MLVAPIRIFQASTDQGILPSDWKEANVVPIYIRREIDLLQQTIDLSH